MKQKAFALAGLAGMGIVAGSAAAAFTGVSIESYVGEGWVENGYAGLSTYRLYANFDGGGDDGVLSAFGIGGLPASVNSWNGLFSNPAEGLDSLTAPQDLRFLDIWENQWDTYVTIGLDTATDDATGLSPGFADATNNLASNWVNENVGWFVTPDDPQSISVDGRVLLAQFSVDSQGDGELPDVYGIVNVLLREGGQIEGIEYSTGIPAPGALALLGLAGLVGSRRRR